LESKAEIIVNAANNSLGIEGNTGINGTILREGGEIYQTHHLAVQTKYGSNFPSGYAAKIPSGELGFDGVILVVSPNVRGQTGPTTDQQNNEFYSCYYNSLWLADEAKAKSIAFPLLGTGAYCFPRGKAAEISLQAIKDFIADYPDTSLKEISLHFLPSLEEMENKLGSKKANQLFNEVEKELGAYSENSDEEFHKKCLEALNPEQRLEIAKTYWKEYEQALGIPNTVSEPALNGDQTGASAS
jgi:O-acetyl-ADP-ribose deacetylase (regulator of RNase III)